MSEKQNAIITGAGRRFGLALCEYFLAEQYDVYAVTRSSSAELSRLAAAHSSKLSIIENKDYDDEGLERVINALPDQHYDILINNASLFEDDAPFGPQSFGQFMQSFQVHMAFPALLSQWFAQQHDQDLRAESGLIINMSDIYAANPMPDRAYYSATKAGLESLTLSYAKSLAPVIRVNSIQPGAIAFLPEYSEDAKTPVLQGSLIAKTGGFGALLKAVDYLCNNEFVTATALKVDGGRSVAR
jgi:dihydromonapterin reductase/dihydrofolate reductase